MKKWGKIESVAGENEDIGFILEKLVIFKRFWLLWYSTGYYKLKIFVFL